MEQPDLNELLIFARVVHAGSFTGAARLLGRPKSTVSRKVSDLEERLGARLLQRTTRKLSLTDAGRRFYEHCERAVAEAEAAQRAVSEVQDQPRGNLKVTAPVGFPWLAALVTAFLRRHPEVQVELVCTDRVVDLVEEGFDVAIRAGRLADSTLVTRHLASVRRFVVASPGYLARHGTPRTPADLATHAGIVFGGGPQRNLWQLESGGESVSVLIPPRLLTNDLEMVSEAAVAGLGIALVQEDRCVEILRRKKLRQVFTRWASPQTPIQAVYPSSRHLSAKVKAFVDHARSFLTPAPWQARVTPLAPRRIS